MGDYQFYQLSEEGRPAPEAQAPRPYRAPVLPWVFLVVVVLILIGSLVFAVNVIRSARGASETRSVVETRYEEGIATCVESGAVGADCEATVRKDLASEFLDPKLCRELSGEARVNCVTVTAVELLDAKACGVLSGDEKEGCEDLLYALVARKENDPSLCEKIANEERRTICRSDFGIVSEALTRAIEANDPRICPSLPTEDERLACIDEYSSIDTDGDGYSDYEEVQNGFSPTE